MSVHFEWKVDQLVIQEAALRGIRYDRSRVCSSIEGMVEMTFRKGIIKKLKKEVKEPITMWKNT